MPFLVANSYFGLALEATRGTAASVSTFTPIMDPKLSPKETWLLDGALRGSPSQVYDAVPGVRHDEFSGKVYVFDDVYPQLLRGTLGSSDTVASVGPSLWTHTIGLFNSASVGSQPPSYTVINNSIDNCYQMTAGQIGDLSISMAADAAVETTFTFFTNISTTTTGPSIVESTQHLIPAWNVSASIGGASVAVVASADIDIKRKTAPQHVLGQQGPYRNWASAIDVTGKMSIIVESGSPYWADALTRDQLQVLFQVTDPVTGYYTLFQMSAVQLTDPEIDQSKDMIMLNTNFQAVANATDAVNGGYSPILTVTKNGTSASY